MSDKNPNKPVVNEFQPSMTEWFALIGEEKESAEFREEDNKKDERLTLLQEIIGLPYRKPRVFEALDVKDRSAEFEEFFEKNGDESCAYRLVPKSPSLPKLRSRGYTVKDCYEKWFSKLEIDVDQYVVHIFPNETEIDWSLFFVIKNSLIFGEIIQGRPFQLSQGETMYEPLQFLYDLSKWSWSRQDRIAQRIVERALAYLYVPEKEKQKTVNNRLPVKFANNYLEGYFESFVLPDGNLYFMDYNRVLAEHVDASPIVVQNVELEGRLIGSPVFPGRIVGRVVIVRSASLSSQKVSVGDILVTDNTDVRFLPLMKKAGAIVTERGGILSHASIVARELKKPCVVGTKNALSLLKEGDLIEVNGDSGEVTILKRAS